MIRRPPRSTLSSSSAASDVYKRQVQKLAHGRRLRGGSLNGAIDDLASLGGTNDGQWVCRWGLRLASAKGKHEQRKERGKSPDFRHGREPNLPESNNRSHADCEESHQIASIRVVRASPPVFCRHFAGASGFAGSAGFGACSFASDSSTRFLKSPWSLCESPLYI